MTLEWLALIKEIPTLLIIISKLKGSSQNPKDLLLRELKLNIKSFETAFKAQVNYDKLVELLSNDKIKEARNNNFNFKKIKGGEIKSKHIRDERNKRYLGKDCGWLFKNIDEKIEELKRAKSYYGSLNSLENQNITLQLTNLFFKMKLLVEFIK
jgi:hypothetical protein